MGGRMAVSFLGVARPPASRVLLLALQVGLVAVPLSGCLWRQAGSLDATATGSVKAAGQASTLAQRYQSDPGNKDLALAYAAELRRDGNDEQATAVLGTAAERFPSDRAVLGAYGKALAATGSLDEALTVIRRAQAGGSPDWRLLSAEGAILDQQGKNTAARKLYEQALQLSPNEPSVLSNLGMSYVMTGSLAEAEKTLRRAVAAPGADSRARQNLALVVGLQGRFDEAERIAGAELSPEQAAANVAYLKSMLSQPNSWDNLRSPSAKPAPPRSRTATGAPAANSVGKGA